MIFFDRMKIGTKVTLTIMVVSLIGALSIALYFPPQLEKLAKAALSSKATAVAEVLAYNLAASLEFEDSVGIEEALAGIQGDPDFIGVQVRDTHGRTVAGHPLNPDLTLNPGLVRVRDRGDHLEVVAPITGQGHDLGTLILHLDTAGVRAEVRNNRVATWLVSGLVALLGLVAGTTVSRRITNPLDELSAAAEAMSEGNLDVQIRSHSHDEVGSLGQAFNTLARNLRKSRSEVEEYNRNLEVSGHSAPY